MYREILARRPFKTPELYAFRWDPPGDRFWLFLEDVGDARLSHVADFDLWVAAACWAARFHAATRHLPAAQTDYLVRLDQCQDQSWAECVQRKLPDLRTADRPLIQRALDHYRGLLHRIRALPQCIVHGEFFPRNIVVRRGRPDQPLAVIDWESAALGPSYLDLVSLTTGRWKTDQRRAMWRAYFEQYQADTGLSLDWEGFCRDLREVTLYHTVKWLGSRPDWNFRRGIAGWVRELEQALPGCSSTGS
jgi:Ser/Thr protein kinase RdoA (MazF antagonist)